MVLLQTETTLEGWTEFDCHRQYPWIQDDFIPSFKVIALTITIIVLSVAIEISIRSFKNPPSPSTSDGFTQESEHSNTADTERSEQPTSSQPNSYQAESIVQWLNSRDNPSPAQRAQRFAMASLLLAACSVAFAFRIRETHSQYPAACYTLVNIAPPHWVLITIFNIVPFSCACAAWLRSLVDCILARYDRTLKMIHWPPALPLFLCVFLVAFPFVLIFKLIRIGALAITGQPISAEGGEEAGIEMREGPEEERGLMNGVDDNEDDDEEATVYSPRSSEEDKKESPV